MRTIESKRNERREGSQASSTRRMERTSRPDFSTASPAAYEAMLGLEAFLTRCGLDPALLELIRLRPSQINGCASCIDMHWKAARARGETEQRLDALDAWRETMRQADGARR